MKKFRIGGVPEHFNLPWRLAIEEGRLDHLDVDLHWSDMTGGTGQMIKGLQAGSIDIAVLLTEGITKAILEGLDAKILAFYVDSPLRWGVHVPTNSGISKTEDIEGKTYAISREGSGSHLMAYVNAHQRGWDISALKFNIVGDVYGGLWALESNEAQAFLWEKYTTQPFVDQGKCRRVGEVVTPWPCFAVAVSGKALEGNKELLQKVLQIVGATAKEIKDGNKWSEIAWRYGLKPESAESWLSETEWNYTGELAEGPFENAVDCLFDMSLIGKEQKESWKEKLFAR